MPCLVRTLRTVALLTDAVPASWRARPARTAIPAPPANPGAGPRVRTTVSSGDHPGARRPASTVACRAESPSCSLASARRGRPLLTATASHAATAGFHAASGYRVVLVSRFLSCRPPAWHARVGRTDAAALSGPVTVPRAGPAPQPGSRCARPAAGRSFPAPWRRRLRRHVAALSRREGKHRPVAGPPGVTGRPRTRRVAPSAGKRTTSQAATGRPAPALSYRRNRGDDRHHRHRQGR